MHSADVDLHCRYMQVSHYYYMHKPCLHDTIWIHVIWIRVLCKRGYICMCTHTRIPSVVALFGRQIVLLVFFNISDNVTSVRYGIHVHTVRYHVCIQIIQF